MKKTKENVEFQLNMVNSEFENSMTKLKMNYEEKQKGLLPYELKQVIWTFRILLTKCFVKYLFICWK